MRGPAVQPIVIAAGGTGGHFFPAEALGAELIRRGHRIVVMTDARSGAVASSVFADREKFVLRGAGVAGRGAWRGAKASAALATGAFQACRILTRLNAGCLIGFGGYPTVAPVLGSRLLPQRPAVILHEQNAVLGRANRFLARHADRLALSFAATARLPRIAIEVTGNPVRPPVAALAAMPYVPPADTIRVLVLGGSLGARILSDVVPDALRFLPDALRFRLSVVQQCRKEDLDRVRAAYSAACIEAELSPFFADVAARLQAAHLVIARAGASTVAELAVAGRPSVLVPLPGAIDDHQSANALALSKAGAAWVMPQSALTAAALAERLRELLSAPALLSRAAEAARGQGRPDAAVRLADLVETCLPQHAARPGDVK